MISALLTRYYALLYSLFSVQPAQVAHFGAEFTIRDTTSQQDMATAKPEVHTQPAAVQTRAGIPDIASLHSLNQHL